MKKLLVLFFISFVFANHAMEQGQKGNKRKRSSFQKEQIEEATETDYVSIIHEIKKSKTKKAITKMLKAGDMLEKNLLIFAPNHRDIFFETLTLHLRNIVQRGQAISKSFTDDFLEIVREQEKKAANNKDKDELFGVGQPYVPEEEMYVQGMGIEGEQ